MKEKRRVVHFINQFFAQIGGEEKAEIPLIVKEGVVGPGMAFASVLRDDYVIVATIICGDNFMSDNLEQTLEEIIGIIRDYKADAVLAGPAFNAGRYGANCGAVCKSVQEKLNIPAVTGMYQENPGVEIYRKSCYIVQTKNSAVGMRAAVLDMARLLMKVMDGREFPDPEKDRYFCKGFKRNVFVEKTGAQRAVEMLLAKVKGEKYVTEMQMPAFESVRPAKPLSNLQKAKIALVTDAGLTDKNNTQHLESARASKFLTLDIAGMDELSPDDFYSVHGGFDTSLANKNPNIIVPLDIMRNLEKKGVVESVYEKIYSTTGNGTSLVNSMKFGSEIAELLKEDKVDAVILTST